MCCRHVGPVAHQTTGRSEHALLIDRGHFVTNSERSKLLAMASEKCISTNHKAARSQSDQFCKRRLKFAFGTSVKHMELQSQRLGRRTHLARLRVRETGTGRVDKQSHDARGGK